MLKALADRYDLAVFGTLEVREMMPAARGEERFARVTRVFALERGFEHRLQTFVCRFREVVKRPPRKIVAGNDGLRFQFGRRHVGIPGMQALDDLKVIDQRAQLRRGT
jgi:hypothetical protein